MHWYPFSYQFQTFTITDRWNFELVPYRLFDQCKPPHNNSSSFPAADSKELGVHYLRPWVSSLFWSTQFFLHRMHFGFFFEVFIYVSLISLMQWMLWFMFLPTSTSSAYMIATSTLCSGQVSKSIIQCLNCWERFGVAFWYPNSCNVSPVLCTLVFNCLIGKH